MLATLALVSAVLVQEARCAIRVALTQPTSAGPPILESFVSFSIEFSSFPDFAGNSTQPNNFSYNLLRNLGDLQGSNPIIRVGGNTQDYATFDPSQAEQLLGSIDVNRSRDYPTTISIGPSYFDSYSTWPNTSYIHGFNLGKNGTVGNDTLVGTVPLVCKALSGPGKLAYWQLGNEPDLFKTSAQGPVRPPSWSETDYVDEWLSKTEIIRDLVQQHCPEVIEQGKFKFYAPSFAGTGNSLNLIQTWNEGINAGGNISLIDSHNYIGGATQPGVTLQGTLMNHSSTVASVAKHLNETRILASQGVSLPYILGETNSLYNQGAPGLSNSFGAALWGVDFNLYCAATGVRRVHMHQGTNYRYASWQPIATANETLGTKAPYYGNIAVARFLGNDGDDSGNRSVSVSEIDLGADSSDSSSIYRSAYAAYIDGRLARIAVIQMRAYNYSAGDAAGYAGANLDPRPLETFSFVLDGAQASAVAGVVAERLHANGSDAVTGVTFRGYSFNRELDEGRPVLLQNVTGAEPLQIDEGGVVSVDVPWSSAVILNLQWM